MARIRFIQQCIWVFPEASVHSSSIIFASKQAAVWSTFTAFVVSRSPSPRARAFHFHRSISSGSALIGGAARRPRRAANLRRRLDLGFFPIAKLHLRKQTNLHEQSRADDIHIHKQFFSHVIGLNLAKMAAIGSLVFCTDCGNLLETNTSRKTYLTCEVCGAQNKGEDYISTSAYTLNDVLTVYRHIQQDHHYSLQAHSVPFNSPHAPALRRTRIRRGRDPNRRYHRPPLRKMRQPSNTLLHSATTIRRRR
jgi:hypothetical protein